MYEKVYKFMLGVAILCFAIYLITKISLFGGLGGVFLILTAFTRFFTDWRTGKLPWKNKGKSKGKQE